MTSQGQLVVDRVAELADGVRHLQLRDPRGATLPVWTPGAHIDLELPSGLVRQYSLCGQIEDRTVYEIAVLREDDGRGGSVEIHDSVAQGAVLGFETQLVADSGTAIYCCGPGPLIDAVTTHVAANCPGATPHVERFRPEPTAESGDNAPFDVQLRRGGPLVHVSKDHSIPAALLAAGVDAPYSCGEGTCGSCATRVIEGIPVRRGDALTGDERAACLMLLCVDARQPQRSSSTSTRDPRRYRNIHAARTIHQPHDTEVGATMTNIDAYRPFWHPVAVAEEVTDTPCQYTLLGERLVAFRSGNDVTVLKDLCIHRGAALSLGRVVEGVIECPYHGWRYGSDGRCVRIPALAADRSIPTKARTTSYPVRVAGGLVWVALDPPVAPFPQWPDGTGDDAAGVRFLNIDCYEWDVDAGRAVENFLDVAHFPFVHEGTLGTRDNTLVKVYDLSSGEYWMKFSYPQEEPADPSTGHGELMDLQYYFHAPFTVHLKRQTPHTDWSVMSLLASPTTATSSRLFVTFSRNFELAPSADTVYHDFTERVMTEDKVVVESVRPEEIPVDIREELHIRVPDRAGLMYRRILNHIERQPAEAV